MSLALYRKYRPATFADLKGQEHVAEPLQQALRNGRIHHAYLFSGPRGCGKTSSARILARSLNCEQGPTPDPCGVCDSCVALGPTGVGHIDVIEIDAASHGGVDDARDLRERAFFAPVAARFKIYIIDEAHMVTREGFNALLKLVEEPPPHLKFVFATTEPEKVIGTIRSRTHHYPFRLIPPGTLRELLEEILQKEGVPFEPAAIPLVVRAGAGSARDSESILDQLLAGAGEDGITYAHAVSLLGYTDSSLLDEVVDAVAGRDGAAVFAAVDRVMEGGQDPRRFAGDLLERFRDLVILSNVPDAGSTGLLTVPPDELERMQNQASRLGPAELARAADLLHTGLTEMRGATAPRLLLELICARILLPAAYEDEASLFTRLERLERRVAIGEPSATPTSSAPTSSAPPKPQQRPQPQQPAQSQPAASASPPSMPEPVAETPRTSTPEERSAPPPPSPPAPASPPPPPQQPTPQPSAQPVSGVNLTEVRRRWTQVLESVKNESKVAWVLMTGVEIASLEGSVLTIAFTNEGNRKGFIGGKDAILRDTLNQMFGVDWRIETILRAPGGSDSEPGNRPASPAPASPDQGGWGAPTPTPTPTPTPNPTSASTAPAQRPAEGATNRPAQRDPARSEPARPDPARSEPAREEPPPPPPPQKPPAPLAEEDEVDPEGDADADSEAALSGMALIERELGGQVIQEIDNT